MHNSEIDKRRHSEVGIAKKWVVWSYGGGVQTAAIAVLVHTGRLPKPDLVVMADTSREATATWEYLDNVMRPYLADVGITVEVAPHSLATVDLYAKNGDLLIPAFTETGKLKTFCSNEWKQRVVHRFLRSRNIKQCDMWLGISTDEFHRAKDSRVNWIKHVYPLLTMIPTNRVECIQLVEKAGLPKPPRSSCWMCPHRSNTEWRSLSSSDWDKAVSLDKGIRERDRDCDVYLHRSARALDESKLESDEVHLDICDGGYCFT